MLRSFFSGRTFRKIRTSAALGCVLSATVVVSNAADSAPQPEGAGSYSPVPVLVPPAPEGDNAPTDAASDIATGRAIAKSPEPWTIQILPAPGTHPQDARSYESIYQSIPYRRSEYLANPSYRHDATLEILFGAQRPTVIHKHDTPQRVVNPRPEMYQPYPISRGEMYGAWPWMRSGGMFVPAP